MPTSTTALMFHASDTDPAAVAALDEYLDHLDSSRRALVLSRLHRSPALREMMIGTVSDMAMLVAAAHVIEDQNEFASVASRAFEECLLDSPEVLLLRLYYFDYFDSIELPAGLARLSKEVAQQRLATQKSHYLILHGYPA